MGDEVTSSRTQLFSSLFAETEGSLSAMIMDEYGKLAETILKLNNPTEEQKLFLEDYLRTISAVARRRAAMSVETEVVNLPETNMHTIKVNELVIKPEVFDGEKPKPRRWLADYQEAIIANGWDDYISIKYFPTFLARAAKDWYFTDVRCTLRPSSKWIHVKKLFEANFIQESDFEQLSQAVENMRQKPSESVSTFIPRLRRMLLMLTPDLPETEQLRQIRTKLRPEYKQWLSYSCPKTLADFREICLKIEAGLSRADQPKKHAEPNIKAASKKSWRPMRKPKGVPNRMVGSTSSTRMTNKSAPATTTATRKPDLICYRCNREGHMSKDCWAKTKKDGTTLEPKQGNSSVNTVTYQSNEWGIEADKVLTIKHEKANTKKANPVNLVIGGGKLIETQIMCNKELVPAIVDTGAYVTVIDEKLTLDKGWKVNQNAKTLIGADGNRLLTCGTTRIQLEIRIGRVSKTKQHEVVVVRNLTAPMLLGLELMKTLRICVDTEKGTLSFQKESIQTGVRTISEEVIPARTQKTIKTKVNADGPIMVLPYQGRSELMVANIITPAEENLADIMVLNPLPKQICVSKDTQIASFETINEETTVGTTIGNVIQIEETDEVIQVGKELNQQQINDLYRIINEHKEAFSINGNIGLTNVHKHTIELTEGAKPFAEPLRRRAQIQVDETRRQIKEMLRDGIIEESNSPWASAYVLAKKKNGEYRLCIDFRKLNEATKKTVYPLPLIEDCLDTLSGKKFFSQIDFASGFWQIPMDEKSKEYTAFRTEDGLFHFKRMPFGLTNAPASFQKTINMILAGLKGLNLQVFIDDVCIATTTWEEHIQMLAEVLKIIMKSNMKIKASKCIMGARGITFLGHEISQDGIRQDPEKLKALLKLPAPKDPKGIKRVMGMFSYYRKFVPNFAIIAEPLTKMTRKGVAFQWNAEQEEAFRGILRELAKNATLLHFNHKDPIQVRTDASHKGVAGILLQKDGQDWKLVTCCSRRLTTSESNYGITDLEGLALIYSVTKFRPYLLGKRFQILVDHCALCVLNKRMPNSARLRRWAIVLSEYDFEIIYTKGKLHQDVDCLSRAPVDNDLDEFLENCVYAITCPLDPIGWMAAYNDPESRELFQRAYEKEDGLRIMNDLIYKDELLFVPNSKRTDIIKGVHSANYNAHPGIEATTAKLKENYWWPKMRDDVEEVIRTCSTCIMNKPERARPAGQMHSFQYFEPGKCVAIDCLGPITESLNGFKHIIVAIDMFTRFIETKAIPDVQSPTFALFLSEYCGRYGVPEQILTDQATTFCNAFMGEICKVFGIEHLKSTPHHSQGNAVVERVIQTLQEKLRLVLDDPLREANWDSVLPVATLAINTSYHKSIGHTPYELTFGRRAPLRDKRITVRATPQDMHAKLIRNYLLECHSDAIAIQCNEQEKSKRFYEDSHRTRFFQLNDHVVIKAPNRKSKLAPKFIGPYKIVGIQKDIYRLEDEASGKLTTRHVADLKPFTRINPVNMVKAVTWLSILMTVLAMVVSANGQQTFDRVRPVIWLAKQQRVQTGVVIYDINFASVSPCSIWTTELTKNPVSPVNSSSKNTQALLEADIVGRIEAFRNECDLLYEREWVNVLSKFPKVKEIHRLPFEIPERKNTVPKRTHETWREEETDNFGNHVRLGKIIEPFTIRRKRGVISDIAGNVLKEAAGQAISIFVGNIVTNLLSAVIERFDPNSNTNRIGRLEDALTNLQKNYEITNEVLKGTLTQVELLTQTVQNTVRRFELLASDFPHYMWVAGVIINKILAQGTELSKVIEQARKGQIETNAMSKIFAIPSLQDIRPEDTVLKSVSLLERGSIHIEFSARIFSPDTRVYEAFGFNHWDQLTEKPQYKEYKGAKKLMYNETSNCIKAIDESSDPIIFEECIELDGEDPALSIWTPVPEMMNISRYVDMSTIKKTLEHNYIYCFPGNITIGDKNYRCPVEVFRLPTDKAFKTSTSRHVPSRIQMNVTQKELAIDNIHVGHFQDDSDVVNELRMFDKITELRAKLESIDNEAFVVSKGKSIWGLITYGIIMSVAGPLVYYLIIYFCICRCRNQPTRTDQTEMRDRTKTRSLERLANLVGTSDNRYVNLTPRI